MAITAVRVEQELIDGRVAYMRRRIEQNRNSLEQTQAELVSVTVRLEDAVREIEYQIAADEAVIARLTA